MTSIWVDCLGRNLGQGFDLLEAAVRDCSNALWETSMWQVPARDSDKELPGPDGTLVTAPAARRALVQRHSTPWSIAWHALEVLDYDLAGEFVPWAPPPPFTGKAHWRDLTTLPSAWSRPQILGYIDLCRQRMRDTLSEMTDAKAATPLPPAHRYRGQPYAWIVTGLPGHTIEHASQIRQFITAASVVPGA
jgi:hypothetical protein